MRSYSAIRSRIARTNASLPVGRATSRAFLAVAVASFALFLLLAVDQITPWPFALYGLLVLVAVLAALRPNREKLRQQQERIITLW